MCFSLWAIFGLLFWAVVIVAVVLIIKKVVPAVFGPLGGPGMLLVQVVDVIIWAGVLIFVIYIVFTLLGCFVGLPHFR